MAYTSLRECVDDLERRRQLRRVEVEVDPHLELGMIQRRVCAAGGPALLFTRVKGTELPCLANLFGTVPRARYVLRHGLAAVEHLLSLPRDPARALLRPWHLLGLAHAIPRRVGEAPVAAVETRLGELPRLVCWPDDGGPFVTLPAVYTEYPGRPGWRHSNLGMYRVQLAGNRYRADREAGLHYQIHRGIGVHHAAALERGESLPVNVFVGGPPSLALAAVMPLPEGVPEIAFAGVLGGRAVRLWASPGGLPVAAEADVCIQGRVHPGRLLPEGPFGDHLGYYSLRHDYPVLEVERVWRRRDAIWPFTTVGRPPQEDSVFGKLIHEMTAPMMPAVLSGVHAVNAVDEAGVHPLLLALASERYEPYKSRSRPAELLTCANAILGKGQLSLAKYLLVCAREDDPGLEVGDVAGFLSHLLRRVDWRADLHFQTCTTADTLDYSGGAPNRGSKLVVAAVGEPRRELPSELPGELSLPDGFGEPRLCLPGVVALRGPDYGLDPESGTDPGLEVLCRFIDDGHPLWPFPLLVVVDDSAFAARELANFLWVTFTRSDPAADVYGVDSFTYQKHWGCRGPLVIDARSKPQHAPVLEEDPEAVARVEGLAASGGPLHGLL